MNQYNMAFLIKKNYFIKIKPYQMYVLFVILK